MSSFYILDVKPLSDIWFANISSHSNGFMLLDLTFKSVSHFKLLDIDLDDDFFGFGTKSKSNKSKNKQVELYQIKKLLHSKGSKKKQTTKH